MAQHFDSLYCTRLVGAAAVKRRPSMIEKGKRIVGADSRSIRVGATAAIPLAVAPIPLTVTL